MTDLFSLAESRQLRDEGMYLSASQLSAAEWLRRAKDTAYFIATRNGEVSADEVLRIMPRPSDVHPNATGSLFRDKRFKLVGYKTSSKVSAHARRIGVYELNTDE
jgi:hypothetical protein